MTEDYRGLAEYALACLMASGEEYRAWRESSAPIRLIEDLARALIRCDEKREAAEMDTA